VRGTSAFEHGTIGTATIGVNLSAAGTVVATNVEGSSGNRYLDRAALDAVQHARFAPALRDCVPSGGNYRVSVEFIND